MKLSIDVDGPLLQMVISYRHFGKTYLSHLQSSRTKTRIQNSFGFLNPEDGSESRKPEVTLVTLLGPLISADLIFLCSVCAAWRDCSVARQGTPVSDPLIVEGSS